MNKLYDFTCVNCRYTFEELADDLTSEIIMECPVCESTQSFARQLGGLKSRFRECDLPLHGKRSYEYWGDDAVQIDTPHLVNPDPDHPVPKLNPEKTREKSERKKWEFRRKKGITEKRISVGDR